MRRRQAYNPRHHAPMRRIHHLGKGKSSVDLLFEKMRNIEILNRNGKSETAATGSQLDANLKNAAHATGKIKFLVVNVPKERGDYEVSSIPNMEYGEERESPKYYIEHDPILKSTTRYAKVIAEYLDMLEKVEQEYIHCRNKVSETEAEIQDFLHELRMPKKDPIEGLKLYQLGHHLEIKRQGFKDQAKFLAPLADHAGEVKDKLSVDSIRKVVDYLKNFENAVSNRIYMPRSNLDLPVGDRFRALPKEEQDFIRENYEKQKLKRIS